MNLNQTLLDAARDEVAREQGFPSWDEMWNFTVESANKISSGQLIEGHSNEAALLAMEKQAEFYEWTHQKYLFYERGKKWKLRYAQAGNRHVSFTTEQLYEIFTTQQ